MLVFGFICQQSFFSQISNEWTEKQLDKANTVKDVFYLNSIEKEAMITLNLARLYPKKFVKLELTDYTGPERYGDYLSKSRFKASLIRTMQSMKPLHELFPDSNLYELANCFALESSKYGIVGHKRKKCDDNYSAECCSYGMISGKQIIMQLLIDHDVPSLGHRKICFGNYHYVGISEAKHSKYNTCCVLDFTNYPLDK